MSNTQNPVFFINTKVYLLLHFLSGRREKNEAWKVASVSWTKRNNMPWGERADRDLEFSFWFSIVVLWYLFASLVSTAARLVWDPFSELTAEWGPWFSSIFISSWLVFNCCLYLVTSSSRLIFQPKSSRYSCLVSEGRHIRFRRFFISSKDLGSPVFFLINFNYRSHSLVPG